MNECPEKMYKATHMAIRIDGLVSSS